MKKYLIIAFAILTSGFTYSANMDVKSKMIADASVESIGGRQNYDNTRYLSWLFFGRRFHVWDKYTGDIRIEYGPDSLVLMNVNDKKGRVWEAGKEITEPTALSEKLQWGYETWINDSYWVVMPFKLHDDGVNLAFAREDVSLEGKPVNVLTMTFNDVGVTPENKYEVFFDKKSKMFSEFAYFKAAADPEPTFRLPWKNWQTFGKIQLSDNRGKAGMAPLNVFQSLPDAVLQANLPAKDETGKLIAGAIIK